MSSPVSCGFHGRRRARSGEATRDIHCVTKWSELNTMWRGVTVDTLLGQVEHDAR